MGNFQTASMDFDEARENVKKIKSHLEAISEDVNKAAAAVDVAIEKNTLNALRDVAGGLGILKPRAAEVPGIADDMLKAINEEEENVDSRLNDRAAASRALSV